MKRALAILMIFMLVFTMIPAMSYASDTGTVMPAADDIKDAAIKLKNVTGEQFIGNPIEKPTVNDIKEILIQIDGQTVDVIKAAAAGSGSNVVQIDWGNVDFYDCGTYEGTVTGVYTPNGGTAIQYSGKVDFTIIPLDGDRVQLEYNGSGYIHDYEGFANLGVGENVVGGFDADNLQVISIDGGTVNPNLYYTNVIKFSDNTLRVEVYWQPSHRNEGNIINADRHIDVHLLTVLDGNYAISGSSTKIEPIKDQVFKGFKAKSDKTTGTTTFTTTSIEPTIYVLAIDSSSGLKKSLKKGTDYEVVYTNNVYGTSIATVTVTGKGDYLGTLTQNFAIVGRTIPTVKVSSTVQGTVPEITVADGKYQLKEGVDYVVTYNDSTLIGKGKGKITVEGRGNYAGSKSVTYEVLAPDATIYQGNVTVTDLEVYYNTSAQTLNAVVAVPDPDNPSKNKILSPGTDYALTYTNNKTHESTSAPVDAGTYSVHVTSSKKYKISGTVYAGTLTIKPIPLDWTEIVFGDTNIIYQGKYVPKIKVRHVQEDFYFVEDVDYTVSYRNLFTNSVYLPSTVVVTPKAGGNITTTGSNVTELIQPFSIGTRSISGDCLSYFTDNENSRLYDGTNFKPSVYVKDIALNKTLTQDVHYTVTYRDSDGKIVTSLNKAGDYTVTITGIGEYSGTDKLTFKVYGSDISKYTVNLYEYSVIADGSSKTPIITSVKLGDLATLSASNYGVSYKDPFGNTTSLIRSPGIYKVVVTGKGSYTGTAEAEFRIIGTPQSIAVKKDNYKVYKTTKPFTITAISSGDTTGYHFESSDPSVASVTQAGTVTIHKLGRAKIKVTTTGMLFSEPASDEVLVKVYPKKATITTKPWTSENVGAFRVRWRVQEDTDLYQIRYSTSSKFKSYKTKTVTASELYNTQSTLVTGLKSKKRYYVKVRAVKKVENDAGEEVRYYGKWSNWRSVVTR